MVRPNRQFEGTSPITLFASAARTATPDPSAIIDGSVTKATGLMLYIKVTAATSTPSTVFTIQKWNPSTMVWDTGLASAAVVGTSTNIYVMHPSAPATTNRSAAANVTPKWRVTAAHGNANSQTYSVLAFPLI